MFGPPVLKVLHSQRREEKGAPKVVAKGKNYLALRIKQKAIDAGVRSAPAPISKSVMSKTWPCCVPITPKRIIEQFVLDARLVVAAHAERDRADNFIHDPGDLGTNLRAGLVGADRKVTAGNIESHA